MLGEGHLNLLNTTAIRRFLFEQSQHQIGGFGKYPGNPPDIYHSYLGLAALAVLQEPGLKPLDSVLCMSKEQRERMEKMRIEASVPTRRYWKDGFCYGVREDSRDFEERMRESEPVPEFLENVMGGSRLENEWVSIKNLWIVDWGLIVTKPRYWTYKTFTTLLTTDLLQLNFEYEPEVRIFLIFKLLRWIIMSIQ